MTTSGVSPVVDRIAGEPVGAGLEFLWLELTNRCNLKCVHCYTESSPQSGDRDLLTTDDYLSVMQQAYELGCRRMQFIGGEPQLHPDFLRLLAASKAIGFEFVEVFTNLTRLDEETVRFAGSAGVRFATSVYSDDPEVHAAITRSASSHARTIRNLKRLLDGGIVTRAAVIQIDQQPAEIERTTRYVTDLGVRHVRHSRVRAFGRGEEVLSQRTQMSELCGHCWSGRLCVAPSGDVYPCVMARRWPVGNVRTAPLADIVHSPALAGVRVTIHDTVWVPKLAAGPPPDGHAAEGGPDEGDERPYPGEGEPAPAECPQSCVPDTVTPKCPQSCDPLIVVCEPTEPTPQEEPAAPGYAEPTPAECPQSGVPEECPQSCEPDACPQSCEPQNCEPGGVVICVPLGDTTQPEKRDGG
jgi:MoaA/NifB/PqqE/SkfB family radical SAM enzyme